MEIRRYIAIVQRWLWLIILGAILVGGVTYLINANTQPIYRASARLLIDQAPDSGANEYAQALFEERLTTTYVELIGLYPVMEETVRRLDLPISANDLKDGLSISAPPRHSSSSSASTTPTPTAPPSSPTPWAKCSPT